MDMGMESTVPGQPVTVCAAGASLGGELALPPGASGVVVFPHGSGVSRKPQESLAARTLSEAGLGVLILDLLTPPERDLDARIAAFRFDLPLLTQRLAGVTDWLTNEPATRGRPLGYFGVSIAGAAALAAAAERTDAVSGIVLLDGRTDLAHESLNRVRAATLLLVGGTDVALSELTRKHLINLGAAKKLQFVEIPSTANVFEEPAALQEALRLALGWFNSHFSEAAGSRRRKRQEAGGMEEKKP
jgi:putative phosphoribosyl transferase